MNRKIITTLIIAAVMAAGCAALIALNKASKTGRSTDTNSHNVIRNGGGKKMLMVFFSRAGENYGVDDTKRGNTEVMAGYLKDYFGDKLDVFRIEPETPYPTSYQETTELGSKEKNSQARPKYKEDVDVAGYDTIFLGYPIWWGEPPMIINTFLEKHDFAGKTIVPFNTHEGSGSGGSYELLKKKLSSANVRTEGLAIAGTKVRSESSKQEVEAWLKKLGF